MQTASSFGIVIALIALVAPFDAACWAEEADSFQPGPQQAEIQQIAMGSQKSESVAVVAMAAEPARGGIAATQAVLDGVWRAPGPDGVARIDYARLASNREALDAALSWYAKTDPSALPTGKPQLAYWLNAYNLSMVSSVVDAWSGRGDWSVSEDEFAVFGRQEHVIGGHNLSLNEIEHGVLRGDDSRVPKGHPSMDFIRSSYAGVWSGEAVDPRIHMALNCASVGCPALSGRAFSAANVEAVLRALSTAYVNDPARGAGQLGVSQIFDWYGKDFEGVGGVKAFVEAYRTASGDVKYGTWIPYDWQLNIVQPVR